MAEKSTEKSEKPAPRKRSTASARQQTLETYAQTLKDVEDRGEAESKPEEKIQAKTVREAVATSYCRMSWMKPESQAASLVPSLKITPATTAGSNVLPLSFRQWF